MTHPRRSLWFRACRLVSIAAVAAVLPMLAAADWRESFAAGVKARDQGQWEDAVRSMQEAIDQNPRATGEKVRVYGMKLERYLPYYYLGIAQYHLKNCQKAVEAFTKARAAGTMWLLGRNHMEALEERCQKKLGITAVIPPPPSPPLLTPPPFSPQTSMPPTLPEDVRREVLTQRIKEAEDVLRPADEQATKIERWLEATDSEIFRRQPALEERHHTACRKLEGTRTLLDAAEREGDLQAVEKALEAATKVLAELEALAREMGAP